MREGKPAQRTGRVKSEDGVPRGKHNLVKSEKLKVKS
jgi:hypothetical protein